MGRGNVTIKVVEEVTVYGEKPATIKARIDTGASRSSIDTKLAADLKLGPLTGKRLVKSASGNSVRPMVNADIKLAGKKVSVQFTIADRAHMEYPVLIGRDVLQQGFIIDPSS
jgi:hypothetical protein